MYQTYTVWTSFSSKSTFEYDTMAVNIRLVYRKLRFTNIYSTATSRWKCNVITFIKNSSLRFDSTSTFISDNRLIDQQGLLSLPIQTSESFDNDNIKQSTSCDNNKENLDLTILHTDIFWKAMDVYLSRTTRQ